jgi:hypothetical protein
MLSGPHEAQSREHVKYINKHPVVLQYYVCEISTFVRPFSIANVMLFVRPSAQLCFEDYKNYEFVFKNLRDLKYKQQKLHPKLQRKFSAQAS